MLCVQPAHRVGDVCLARVMYLLLKEDPDKGANVSGRVLSELALHEARIAHDVMSKDMGREVACPNRRLSRTPCASNHTFLAAGSQQLLPATTACASVPRPNSISHPRSLITGVCAHPGGPAPCHSHPLHTRLLRPPPAPAAGGDAQDGGCGAGAALSTPTAVALLQLWVSSAGVGNGQA